MYSVIFLNCSSQNIHEFSKLSIWVIEPFSSNESFCVRRNIAYMNFLAPFLYGIQLLQGCRVITRRQILPLSPQKFHALIWSTSEGWQLSWTWSQPVVLKEGNPELEIQCLKHQVIDPLLINCLKISCLKNILKK